MSNDNTKPMGPWPETLRAHATTYGVAVERVTYERKLAGIQTRRARVEIPGHAGVHEARATRRRKRQAVAAWKRDRRAGEAFKAWMRRANAEAVAA